MSHANPLVDYLRAFGPSAGANSQYDEHVLAAAERYGVSAPIEIPPARLDDLAALLSGPEPRNVILTGTAGDGKTYHCRKLFGRLGGDPVTWRRSGPLVDLGLPGGPTIRTVKDLSELGDEAKAAELAGLTAALAGADSRRVYLLAANDGQLLKYWRDFVEHHPGAGPVFEALRTMLKDEVEDGRRHRLDLTLINLSRQASDAVFEPLIDAVVEHPDWNRCAGCPAERDGCPIRGNRELLCGGNPAPFRQRLGDLVRLSAADDSHLPIRQQLLLLVNILLGDRHRKGLLTCGAVQADRATSVARANPYDNALGLNLPAKVRAQYRAFATLEGLGLGRETNNAIDGFLVNGTDEALAAELERLDTMHGAAVFEGLRRAYRVREDDTIVDEFREALESQRRRLFFLVPDLDDGRPRRLDPWWLTVYEHGGLYLRFYDTLHGVARERPEIRGDLILGLNRTFSGMMCDDRDELWLVAPAGGGSTRLGRVLDCDPLKLRSTRRDPLRVGFDAGGPGGRPRLVVNAGETGHAEPLAVLHLRPLVFEYLMRVARGSLPASFSRQCFEEIRHFRMRLIGRLARERYVDPRSLEHLELVSLDERGHLKRRGLGIQEACR